MSRRALLRRAYRCEGWEVGISTDRTSTRQGCIVRDELPMPFVFENLPGSEGRSNDMDLPPAGYADQIGAIIERGDSVGHVDTYLVYRKNPRRRTWIGRAEVPCGCRSATESAAGHHGIEKSPRTTKNNKIRAVITAPPTHPAFKLADQNRSDHRPLRRARPDG
jgi:hypothetical protein